ncbi:hypothetical protein MRB53_041837 [Persea americana]|nr:hypothetical protein MRB53_041837 [Persea americana]
MTPVLTNYTRASCHFSGHADVFQAPHLALAFFLWAGRFHSTAISTSSWTPGPSPPRLPAEEQEIYEKLLRDSTGAFSTPAAQRDPPKINQSPQGYFRLRRTSNWTRSRGVRSIARVQRQKVDEKEALHPNVRRGAQPEFEGNTNPRTKEVGGPKNDPLLHNEWTFNAWPWTSQSGDNPEAVTVQDPLRHSSSDTGNCSTDAIVAVLRQCEAGHGNVTNVLSKWQRTLDLRHLPDVFGRVTLCIVAVDLFVQGNSIAFVGREPYHFRWLRVS